MSIPFQLPKIIVILGPTASGKSALAVKLAEKFNAEIVSADSRQVYRGMDIGTAKPDKKELSKIKHHLIDIKNPDEEYTAYQYKKDALAAISKILSKNKIPILVGGTGLYISAITENWTIPKVKSDKFLRTKIEEEIKRKGLANAYQKLLELDPEATYIIDKNNPRRVIRALEIIYATGKKFSKQREKGRPLFNCLKIGLLLSKNELRRRIEKRAERMVKNGLVKEVKNLIEKYGENQPVFDAIGYREIINYLQNRVSLNEAKKIMIQKTLQYAKRQMTWFKKDKNVIWTDNPRKTFAMCRDWLGL